ncbi:hypothetical protein [Neptuniibacter sp. QD57_21]|uniref:hypothetical protein n=1 Tax=Neptuniibacter sp. QD57_21 TaxID=3398213 RepID=UPI0039F586B3
MTRAQYDNFWQSDLEDLASQANYKKRTPLLDDRVPPQGHPMLSAARYIEITKPSFFARTADKLGLLKAYIRLSKLFD